MWSWDEAQSGRDTVREQTLCRWKPIRCRYNLSFSFLNSPGLACLEATPPPGHRGHREHGALLSLHLISLSSFVSLSYLPPLYLLAFGPSFIPLSFFFYLYLHLSVCTHNTIRRSLSPLSSLGLLSLAFAIIFGFLMMPDNNIVCIEYHGVSYNKWPAHTYDDITVLLQRKKKKSIIKFNSY